MDLLVLAGSTECNTVYLCEVKVVEATKGVEGLCGVGRVFGCGNRIGGIVELVKRLPGRRKCLTMRAVWGEKLNKPE